MKNKEVIPRKNRTAMASNPNISKSKRLSQNAKDSIAELVALTRNGMPDAAAELHSVGVFAVSMLAWLLRETTGTLHGHRAGALFLASYL